jgi:hypothetical protein
LRSIGRSIFAAKYLRQLDDFTGTEWERAFASAIGADWIPSNVGLDDIQKQNTCWGAKTVKCSNPATAHSVRLISGRNSIDYSFGQSDSRAIDPSMVGKLVLEIWNERVNGVVARFAHARTVVLMKGEGLSEVALFEVPLERFDSSLFEWSWNKNSNLVGKAVDGSHRFTWQPHGSQFTIIEHVPETRYVIQLCPPEEFQGKSESDLLKAVGFRDTWLSVREVTSAN